MGKLPEFANKGVSVWVMVSVRKTQPWIWKVKFGEQTGNDLE